MSQTDTVLKRLEHHRSICSFSFFDDPELGHRLAARVYDLRSAGHRITAEPCTVELHNHRSRAVRYSLIEEGALF